jgi:hypothetical protein
MSVEEEIKALAERNRPIGPETIPDAQYAVGDIVRSARTPDAREFTHRETDIVRSARSPHQPGRFGRPINGLNATLTASAVQERIAELTKRAQALLSVAQGIEGQLAGSKNAAPERGDKAVNAEMLFARQLAALDELGEVLDALARSLERANGALA